MLAHIILNKRCNAETLFPSSESSAINAFFFLSIFHVIPVTFDRLTAGLEFNQICKVCTVWGKSIITVSHSSSFLSNVIIYTVFTG